MDSIKIYRAPKQATKAIDKLSENIIIYLNSQQ